MSRKAEIPTRLTAAAPSPGAVSVIAGALRGFRVAIVLLVLAIAAYLAGPANAQTGNAAAEDSAARVRAAIVKA
ncbi:hypothetical protein N8I71_10510 [Roseibacterium sp. SDUM158016]|uniref:hypothetical protein n=1 Tax=Roseicyclus sediminis TaxID=2980997 RepID=UPI0021D128AA|nr:hypothetical protein [Roseibacterium sp. SDUM158016]MCU4653267.1 hypothetical protein [Roseibacterium sp. SDUM158016]